MALAIAAAVSGVSHAVWAGLVAGAAGSAVGVGVCLAAPRGGSWRRLVLAAGCAVVAFGAVAYVLDQEGLKADAVRLRRLARR